MGNSDQVHTQRGCRGAVGIMLLLLLASAGASQGQTAQRQTATPTPQQDQQGSPRGAESRAPTRRTLVFDQVAVVDVTTGRVQAAQRVVIVGIRIRALGDARTVPAPRGARVIDARGKYLIPGLWDMHAHNVNDAEEPLSQAATLGPQAPVADRYAVYLGYGVTGVRDMMTSIPLDSLHWWRRQVAAGARVGPRVVASGRYLDSSKPPRIAFPAHTPEEVIRAVDSLKAMGADLVKIHEWGNAGSDSVPPQGEMPRATYFALAAEARRLGIPFAGHTPPTISMDEASDSGQRSLEHANMFQGRCWPIDSMGSVRVDSIWRQGCAELVAKLLRNNTWLDPNLVTRDEADRRIVHAIHEYGNPFLAGTDVPVFVRHSDYALDSALVAPTMVHRELALFVAAGLTPLEALQTATLNAAKALGATDSLGTIAVGQLADLVLLDANPLVDITHTEKVHAVVANGRYFDRRALDRLLVRAKLAARRLIPSTEIDATNRPSRPGR